MRQECDLVNGPELVLAEVQMLKVLVGVDLRGETFNRRLGLGDREGRKSVRATVY